EDLHHRIFDGDASFHTHPEYGGTTDWGFGNKTSDTDDDVAMIQLSGSGIPVLVEQAGLYHGPLAVGDTIDVVAYGLGSDPGGSKYCSDGTSDIKRIQDYTLKTVE